MDEGRAMVWVEMALDFIRQCLTEGLAAIFEFPKTFDTVSKMRQSNVSVKKQLQKWLTDLRVLAAAKEEQKAQTALPGTPTREPTAREHVMLLIDRWLRIWTTANDTLFGNYLQMMHQYGVLKTEEAADKFFRIATELCVEACLKSSQAGDSSNPLNFTVVDALAKLFLLLVRLADKEAGDMSVRVSLLARILNAVARCLLDDHESKKSGGVFDQRPYLRLFSFLSQDFGVPDPKGETNPALLPLLTTFSQIYLLVQPTMAPGFAFAWLQLISHRSFMPHLLLAKGQKGWPIMHRLLMTMLLFLQPFLKRVQLTDAIRKLYKSFLRVFLVILHDFPEFLSDYHLSLCDLIPSTCVQLRNLVLSAFPRTMRLPDPFTPNLKVDLLPDINQTPRIMSDYAGILSERGLRQHIDTYLATRQPVDLPISLANIFASTAGNYSIPLITALVVYIGSQGILQQQLNKAPLAVDMFRALVTQLDAEGRYLVLSAMVNQLRFPNSHTVYFSRIILMLFLESDTEMLQEQITRVLLERLVAHRPHPVSALYFYCVHVLLCNL
jgi:CCR4-NOT transcription complex subunit 1